MGHRIAETIISEPHVGSFRDRRHCFSDLVADDRGGQNDNLLVAPTSIMPCV